MIYHNFLDLKAALDETMMTGFEDRLSEEQFTSNFYRAYDDNFRYCISFQDVILSPNAL